MVDSHCHLYDDILIQNIDAIVENFQNDDIDFVINPSCDFLSEKQAFDLAQKYEKIYCALAIHPHDAKSYNDECEQFVLNNYTNKKVVALGEFGFDYFYNLSPFTTQIEVCERQMQLCNKCDLPAIFHIRDGKPNEVEHFDAYADFFDLAKNISLNRGGVLHCFGGNKDIAKKALDLGFYISFTGNVTYNSSEHLREAVKYIPLDRLLIETDSPYMSPKFDRKTPNTPKNVKYVAECFANLKNLDIQTIYNETTKNTKKLFYKIK